MTDQLSAFLRAASGRPFHYGGGAGHDCFMWLADWIAERHGYDPALGWRGTYRTAGGALRILRRRGGAVAHLQGILEPFGVSRTDEPRRGDIAVVDAPEGHSGAIVLGDMQARVAERGVVIGRWPIIAAWRV